MMTIFYNNIHDDDSEILAVNMFNFGNKAYIIVLHTDSVDPPLF